MKIWKKYYIYFFNLIPHWCCRLARLVCFKGIWFTTCHDAVARGGRANEWKKPETKKFKILKCMYDAASSLMPLSSPLLSEVNLKKRKRHNNVMQVVCEVSDLNCINCMALLICFEVTIFTLFWRILFLHTRADWRRDPLVRLLSSDIFCAAATFDFAI
jgi:hypothetical protein